MDPVKSILEYEPKLFGEEDITESEYSYPGLGKSFLDILAEERKVSENSIAYEKKIEQEKHEYLNIKEARDKKYNLEQELAELKEQEKNQNKKAGTVTIVSSALSGRGGNPNFADPELQKRIDELEKQISDMGKDITLAERAQGKKYLYNHALSAEDFDEYSAKPQKEEPEVIRPHQQNLKRETETLKGYMTEDEAAIYNYYLNKFGEEKAEEFFESIEDDLNYRQAQAIFSGNEGKVLNEYIQGAAAGFESAKEGYKGTLNMLLGIDDPQPTSTYQYLGGMAREDLAKSGIKLPEALGGASLGQLGYDLVNTTANMLPSMMLGTLGGGAIGAAAIGASAAGNAYNEMINAGYGKEQATNYAALVGVSEASLGYLLGGIEATGGKLSKAALAKVLPKVDNALAKVAVNVGGKMLSEFSEEYLQEVLDPVFRNIALMEDNEIDLLSPEAIYSGIMGALSAGGIAIAGGTNVDTEVPVPFDGKAQPGTEEALVADKISEIENRPISEAEKAAKMEEVMRAVAGTTKTPEVIAEAKRFRDIHRERAADIAACNLNNNRKGTVVEDFFGEKKEITDIEYEEILQFKNCEYKINIQNGVSCFPKTDGIYKNVQKVKPVKYGKKNEYCFDIGMHGNPKNVAFSSAKDAPIMTPKALAVAISQNTNYKKGQPVRLLSCSTGKVIPFDDCFAQKLANEINAPVRAPTDILYIDKQGGFKIGEEGTGEWKNFYPKYLINNEIESNWRIAERIAKK